MAESASSAHREDIRNVAIVAHVDHGKTTLVDKLLTQSGVVSGRVSERMMDSQDLEKEKGITILAKNTAINWGGFRINIVDTPGHADFSGEVERIISMVDSVLLLVDAVEGPMPQTSFVTRKAFEAGLNPIVCINKIDRDGARPDWVLNEVFDLFDRLGATESQLDFPVVYASALTGVAGYEADALEDDLAPLFQTLVDHVPAPAVEDGPFAMQVSALDYSSYVGLIGLGRVARGSATTGMSVRVAAPTAQRRDGRILQILVHDGLGRREVEVAEAGDIVSVTGIEPLGISDTLCDPARIEPLPPLKVDEPTVAMTFSVNDSPFAGRDGTYLTSRQIRERLERETLYNVALRVEDGGHPDRFRVAGRGELHLSVLIETMRREGYELAVSRPEVILREVDGRREEPFEDLVVDLDAEFQGAVMERLGALKAEIRDIAPDGRGRVRLVYVVPSRSLIGFRSQFLTMTSGTGIMTHAFSHYAPVVSQDFSHRNNGVLVSMIDGVTSPYSLFNLQARGRLFVGPGEPVYEGMLVGLHSRGNDLVVNPVKEKQLTNIRAAGRDENVILTSPMTFNLEQALEFIAEDELLEVTPGALRLRKRFLKEYERKRAARAAEA